MNKSNLLIGAISANYQISDVEKWVLTSNWNEHARALLVYNVSDLNSPLLNFLQDNNIEILQPTFNFWGDSIESFPYNTGVCNTEVSYNLIHNIRFLHIWNHLQYETYNKILITDVRDVYFNYDPFPKIPDSGLIASSEEIYYKDHHWNRSHLSTNLGIIGRELLSKPVYNVGVFGGSYSMVKDLCADIYLISAGKWWVADQTSFNYLIQTKYYPFTQFTDLSDKFAAHLHVVNEGHVSFDYDSRREYAIIHQYDRIPSWEV